MYATAFIHNAATGRIHTAYFTPAPFTGGPAETVIRWRSRGHHTDGAETQEQADQHMARIRGLFPGSDETILGHVAWDGEGIPA